jgi:YfiH family protein
MLLVGGGDSCYFQFKALGRFDGLTHAVGCRTGGVSQGPFSALNVSFDVGDAPDAVARNRRRWRRLSGGGVHVYARQNHGTSIGVVGPDTGPCDQTIRTLPTPVDALITDVPGIRLLIQTADCQAVLLVDPQRRVVANVHCGWRGSVANIIGLTVARMQADFGCDPGQMTAAIGPSLGPCCAEFVNHVKELPMHFRAFRADGDRFDFWRISQEQLVTAGLRRDRVHTAGICTRCNPDLFYSYRAAHRTGRCAALIGLEAL